MRTIILCSLLLLPTAALAGRDRPIHTGSVTYDKSIAHKKVAKAIKKALLGRGWKVREENPGKIKARINLRKHQADILITYGKGEVTLAYVDSTNLRYKVKKGKKMIHRSYNNWIINLEKDISLGLLD